MTLRHAAIFTLVLMQGGCTVHHRSIAATDAPRPLQIHGVEATAWRATMVDGSVVWVRDVVVDGDTVRWVRLGLEEVSTVALAQVSELRHERQQRLGGLGPLVLIPGAALGLAAGAASGDPWGAIGGFIVGGMLGGVGGILYGAYINWKGHTDIVRPVGTEP